MTVKNYVLDINKTSLQHPSIVLRQDDYNIYTVNISVTENGVPVNLGSYTLNFLGITPAGAKIIDSENFITNASDLAVGKFSYRFPKEASGSKGIYDVAYFRLKTTSGATSTIDLNLRVLGGIDLTADEVKDYITVDDTLRNTLISEVFKKVDAKVDEHLATVVKGDKGDKGDPGKDGYMPIIGGRNLLLGTANWSGDSTRWEKRGTVTDNPGTYRGMTIASTSGAWTSPVYKLQNAGILQVGKTYTFSTHIRNTSDTDTKVAVYYDSSIITTIGVITSIPAHTDWTRVSTTFTVIKDPTTSTYGLRWEAQNALTNGQIQFAGYKLEEGNVPTDWTPAPEDADNTYLKKSQQLPADARDFNYLATRMKTYQGTWWTGTNEILNGPTSGWTWATVEIIPGNAENTGTIRTTRYSTKSVYSTNVDAGTIRSWSLTADDAQLIHKTGNETVAGDKTFTGQLNASALKVAGADYTKTVSVTTDYLGVTISFMRIGRQVTFTSGGNAFNTSVAVGWTNNVLPNGFKPALQQNVGANNQDGENKFFSFDPSGLVYSFSTYTPGTQPRISGTYITTDSWPAN